MRDLFLKDLKLNRCEVTLIREKVASELKLSSDLKHTPPICERAHKLRFEVNLLGFEVWTSNLKSLQI